MDTTSGNATHGDSYEDDGVAFDITDCEENRIRVRVGPVFNGNDAHPEPGVWISFSDWDGEHIVISPETFRALAGHVEKRLCRTIPPAPGTSRRSGTSRMT
jgi:hypothetical protein